MSLRQVYITVPLIPRAYPAAVLSTLNQSINGGPYGSPPPILATKSGQIDLPVGALSVEMLTDDAYFFDNGQLDHTLESMMGITRNKSLVLDGTMRIACYAYLSDFAHVRLTYA